MKELIKRTSYGFIFVILVIGSILFSKYAFAALMLSVSLIGTYEMLIMQLQKKMKPSLSSMVLLISFLFYSTLSLIALKLIAEKYLILTLLFVLFPFLHALFSKSFSFTEIAVIYWPSLLLVSLPASLLIFFYNSNYVSDFAGPQLIISVLLMVWINDVFAYLVGVSIGRHRLFKRISPKKSWEGSIGGLVFTVSAAAIYSYYTDFMTLGTAVGLAVIVVLFGSLGDLIESMIKRQANVKDSGKIIPGHGGILDRFDATFYAVPFVFIYLILIQ